MARSSGVASRHFLAMIRAIVLNTELASGSPGLRRICLESSGRQYYAKKKQSRTESLINTQKEMRRVQPQPWNLEGGCTEFVRKAARRYYVTQKSEIYCTAHPSRNAFSARHNLVTAEGMAFFSYPSQ